METPDPDTAVPACAVCSDHGQRLASGEARRYDERQNVVLIGADASGLAERARQIRRLGPLTPRESDIAELVSTGLSNKEIAQRLVLSTRTVENHVQRILTKLGMRSRTQIALWVLRDDQAFVASSH